MGRGEKGRIALTCDFDEWSAGKISKEEPRLKSNGKRRRRKKKVEWEARK